MSNDEKHTLIFLLRKKIELLESTPYDDGHRLQDILDDIEVLCADAWLKCIQ